MNTLIVLERLADLDVTAAVRCRDTVADTRQSVPEDLVSKVEDYRRKGLDA